MRNRDSPQVGAYSEAILGRTRNLPALKESDYSRTLQSLVTSIGTNTSEATLWPYSGLQQHQCDESSAASSPRAAPIEAQ
jgi:hypothetical protein